MLQYIHQHTWIRESARATRKQSRQRVFRDKMVISLSR